MVPLSKNVGERPSTKNYHPFSLLFVVSKVFEKLVSNMIVDPLDKCDLFSDFQYGLRSSQSTKQIFWQLHLIELLGLLACLELLQL